MEHGHAVIDAIRADLRKFDWTPEQQGVNEFFLSTAARLIYRGAYDEREVNRRNGWVDGAMQVTITSRRMAPVIAAFALNYPCVIGYYGHEKQLMEVILALGKIGVEGGVQFPGRELWIPCRGSGTTKITVSTDCEFLVTDTAISPAAWNTVFAALMDKPSYLWVHVSRDPIER